MGILEDDRPLAAYGLAERIQGSVVQPGDAEWDEARQAWNLAVDQRPAAVVLAESAADVVATVEVAASRSMSVAAQGTGHAASPLRLDDQTILLRTSRMREVTVDPVAGTARAAAGALWQDVTAVASEHGLAALAGSSPDVGVVGYTLGGGLSWLARSHGLAANSVTAIEVVTADGVLRRVDETSDPDLFWALRGGGGSYGIVTAIEFRLYPITEVFAGMLLWPIERAGEVLHAWREWSDTLSERTISVGRILQLPPIPDIPEPFRGRSFVAVEAVHQGDQAEGDALIAPLRALEPEIDTFGIIPASALQHLHMDPEHPVPGVGDGMLLADLTPKAIDTVISLAGAGSGSPLLSYEIRQLGGAIGRSGPGRGALDMIDAGFVTFAVGIAMTPEMGAAIEQRLDLLAAALEPWSTGTAYANFTERPADPARVFPGDRHWRLRQVKATYDPAGMFRSNHPI